MKSEANEIIGAGRAVKGLKRAHIGDRECLEDL